MEWVKIICKLHFSRLSRFLCGNIRKPTNKENGFGRRPLSFRSFHCGTTHRRLLNRVPYSKQLFWGLAMFYEAHKITVGVSCKRKKKWISKVIRSIELLRNNRMRWRITPGVFFLFHIYLFSMCIFNNLFCSFSRLISTVTFIFLLTTC